MNSVHYSEGNQFEVTELTMTAQPSYDFCEPEIEPLTNLKHINSMVAQLRNHQSSVHNLQEWLISQLLSKQEE